MREDWFRDTVNNVRKSWAWYEHGVGRKEGTSGMAWGGGGILCSGARPGSHGLEVGVYKDRSRGLGR